MRTTFQPPSPVVDALRERVPDLLIEWQALTAEQPWRVLPDEHRVDNLLPALLACPEALRTPRFETARRMVGESCTHRVHRQELGFPHHLLLVEYQLLRDATSRIVQRVPLLPKEEQLRLICALDIAITFMGRAALMGYHRPELMEAGRWDGLIDGLARDFEQLYEATRMPLRTG